MLAVKFSRRLINSRAKNHLVAEASRRLVQGMRLSLASGLFWSKYQTGNDRWSGRVAMVNGLVMIEGDDRPIAERSHLSDKDAAIKHPLRDLSRGSLQYLARIGLAIGQWKARHDEEIGPQRRELG